MTTGNGHGAGANDDFAAAWALDALTPEERAAFDAHASEAARAEAASFASVASHLAADSVTPPPSLRAAVLDAIGAIEQEAAPQVAAASTGPRHAAGPSTTAPAGAEPAATDETAPREPVAAPGPAERRARAKWHPLTIVTSIAAGIALLLGGIGIGSQLHNSTQEQLGAVVAAADAERSQVELASGGTATVVWSAERGQSAVLFDGLAAAPHGHEYQAWYIDGEGPHSAGVFQASGDNTTHLLEGEMHAGVAVGVTIEPLGGSAAPTTDPFLVVQT